MFDIRAPSVGLLLLGLAACTQRTPNLNAHVPHTPPASRKGCAFGFSKTVPFGYWIASFAGASRILSLRLRTPPSALGIGIRSTPLEIRELLRDPAPAPTSAQRRDSSDPRSRAHHRGRPPSVGVES